MNQIQLLTKTIGKSIMKNSPTILTSASVAGLITTTLLAIRATPKALLLLNDEEEERWKKHPDGDFPVITKKETVIITWKCYVPAAISGAVTIACMLSANSINLRRNAALAGLYSLSETALKEYQAKVVETIGQNKERKIKDEIAKDKIDKDPVTKKEVIITGKGEVLCYDSLSGRYFKSDIEQIRKALNNLSSDLITNVDDFISLNEVYSELGLSSTKTGDMLGWYIDDTNRGIIEPNFSSHLTDDGRPCLVLDFVCEPRYIYTD